MPDAQVSVPSQLLVGDQRATFLPPATKLGQGNIFTSVCQEFCPLGGRAWQGACVVGGMHSGGCAWQGACMAGGHVWQGEGDMHGRGACMAGGVRGRYYEIRSMSGRYALYWNAFLFYNDSRIIF